MAALRLAESTVGGRAFGPRSGLVLACSLKEQALGTAICPAWHILGQQPAPSSIWECLSFGLIPCLLCLCVTKSHRPGLALLISAVVRDQPPSIPPTHWLLLNTKERERERSENTLGKASLVWTPISKDFVSLCRVHAAYICMYQGGCAESFNILPLP